MEDAYSQLSGLGTRIKARLQVTFVNSAGAAEAGIDQGGLMKELLEGVVKRGFSSDYGLFQVRGLWGSGFFYYYSLQALAFTPPGLSVYSSRV